MRSLGLAVVAVWFVVTANAQWKHQLLASGLQAPLGRTALDPKQSTYFVAPNGESAFTTWDGALWRNGKYYAQGVVRGMTPQGQVAWHGGGAAWLDNVNVSAGLSTGVVLVSGVTHDGRVIWADEDYRRGDELYVGRTPIGARSLLGANGRLAIWDYSANGNVGWIGSKTKDINIGHAFVNATDITAAVLPGATSSSAVVDDLGHVAWDARVPGPYVWLYRDTTNLSVPILGRASGAGTRGIDALGNVLWGGAAVGSPNTDVFFGELSLTQAVYPTGVRYGDGIMVTPNGHALWVGCGNPGDGDRCDVWVNQRNVTTPVFGVTAPRTIWGAAVDWAGHALWHGNYKGLKQQVFVDNFNLSADALGDENSECTALTMSSNGIVLWMRSAGIGRYDYWLSTPVPEPAGLALAPIVLFVRIMAGRRKRCSSLTRTARSTWRIRTATTSGHR